MYGRLLGVGEMRRIMCAENIIAAHRARAQSGDWEKWARTDKAASRLLNWAMKAHLDGKS